MTSYNEIIDQFRADMAEAGMVVHEPLFGDSILRRVHVEGDRPGKKSGSYVLHVDKHPAGYFEHFPQGLKVFWRLSGSGIKQMSLAMRRQIEEERKKRQDERRALQKQTAEKARFIWDKAKPVSESAQHPYLLKKCIKPHGVRLGLHNRLIVPLYTETRKLVNLQFIDPDGEKRFLAGGKKRDCFGVIGNSADIERLLICEGWATGASLHEELGVFVMVAMDAGNLEPVAQAARRLFPDAEIIIAGDNDETGTGQAAARKAALAVDGKVLIPKQAGTDWNDVLTTEGAA